MVYKPKVITRSYGVSDTATVRVVQKKGLMIHLKDADRNLKIPFSKCPKETKYTDGVFRVKVNDEELLVMREDDIMGVIEG